MNGPNVFHNKYISGCTRSPGMGQIQTTKQDLSQTANILRDCR